MATPGKDRNVLTLVGPVDDEVLRTAVSSVEGTGGCVEHRRWLVPSRACDIFFAGLDPKTAEEAVRRRLADLELGIDLAAQPVNGRRKRLLVADLESTVIHNEMLDEIAELAGCGGAVERLTARAMNGELDFRDALRQRVALLRGLPVEVLEEASRRIEIDAGAAVLVATMRAHGAFTALVSGGFGIFAEPIRERLGFDVRQCNELGIENGALTGRVPEPILDRDAKLRALERFCADRGLATRDAAAVGDGANDLAMIEAAGLGVAYHAKASVAAAARFRVDHGDLSTLLCYQGYPPGEWAVT